MGILLKNGQRLNKNGQTEPVALYVEDGKIQAAAYRLEEKESVASSVVDLQGKLVAPGLIDMHVHLRDPGFEAKETVTTGTQAAARGGFTTVACMPNTRPVTDAPEIVRSIRKKAEDNGSARVLPIAAITIRELGKELTDFASLQEAGAVALSDDGVGVQSSGMMKEAMKRARALNLPIVAHCEDNTLVEGGSVHDGAFARKHDLRGIPSESEAVHVGRDCLLAEVTGARYHVCHISAEASVRRVRQAKEQGANVSAEVTPHHLLLCDEDIPDPDPKYKMNPPLRSARDREALIEGLQDGTIDFVATDHAPHTAEEKAKDISKAPFGIVGLETAFPLLYTHLVLQNKLDLPTLLDKMTRAPADVFQLPWGSLREGNDADITVIDLEEKRTVRPEHFYSKGQNTPFDGWELQGWPVLTLSKGRIVWDSTKKGREIK